MQSLVETSTKEHIVPGDRQATPANCRDGDTGRTFQKGAAIDERLGRIHSFCRTK
jgi:hypothetical protein